MQKNIVIACGLGDIFMFLTRLDDFFEKNPEYTSVKFWSWIHHPKLAKELVSLSKHKVSIFSLEDMQDYLREIIPEEVLPNAEKFFIKQNVGGVGVDKYLEFINRFFPNLESWSWVGTYKKYNTTYPFCLDVEATKREKEYIIVHPISSTVKTEKAERTWSTTRWGRAIGMIRDHCINEEVIIIGTDKDKVEGPRDFPAKGVTDLRGKTSLTETIGLINGAKVVVGINSWPTLMAYWNNTPTYVQWFVQQQFLDTHVPQDINKMHHVHFELPKLAKITGKIEHPSTDNAWVNIRKVLDAAVTI